MPDMLAVAAAAAAVADAFVKVEHTDTERSSENKVTD